MQKSAGPDYIFEVSWEVCNKIGGIHTVITSKLKSIQSIYKDKYIFIGPDINKDTSGNPEFEEDKQLLREWKEELGQKGIDVRVGRWKITGNPIAVLVDFTSLFPKKDQIFAEFWESYKLDSLNGQWDYIEPALFGYVAGQVIESYYHSFLARGTNIVAHFHEWMAGNGILYLKSNAPQISTVFTTHATVLGRSIAGNGLNLYENLNSFNPDVVSTEFNLRSKFSLEQKAAENAHVFTTVSEVTSKECEAFLKRKPDFITPNGFDDSIVPGKDAYQAKREKARSRMIEVAKALSGKNIEDDALITIISGRYEYRNKGIDIFLESLKSLKPKINSGKSILAYITIPTAHYGPDVNLINRLNGEHNEIDDAIITHNLVNYQNDPVINFCNQNGLNNLGGSNLTVVFVPAYLNGDDGIFNMSYYDLLTGTDLSIFPSYYEPWGYTPLESLAFSIPTITTNRAGFGMWVNKMLKKTKDGILVLSRTDSNEKEAINLIVEKMLSLISKTEEEIAKIRAEAFEISRIAQWEQLIKYYFDCYENAIGKVETKTADRIFPKIELKKTNELSIQQKAIWKKVLIKPVLPKELEKLEKLSKNLWWTWNPAAQELFQSLDHELWEKMGKNPISLLEEISISKLKKLSHNKEFMKSYQRVMDDFEKYMSLKHHSDKDLIAYFSMEFGLHETLKIYSGGLGVLAGDYLKQASDSNSNMVGIGLLYRYGYFNQQISAFGDQIDKYIPQKFSHLPLIPVRDKNGNWSKVVIALPGRNMYAKIWRVDIGRIPLYLMDTDIEENQMQDREVTHKLYGGNWENRLKQELLLGVGGIRLLNQLDIQPEVFHANEGHAAFNSVERLNNLINNANLSFEDAKEVVRSTTLFTTHTPVPAGHDSFGEDLLRKYIPHYANRLRISWEEFMNMGDG
jgi:phosphorylase/glycogen(starch) synthase